MILDAADKYCFMKLGLGFKTLCFVSISSLLLPVLLSERGRWGNEGQ